MIRLSALVLCGFILLGATPALASPFEQRLLNIMQRTPPATADYEQFFLLLKDDPNLTVRGLYHIWQEAKQKHDIRLEAQSGWYIARAASYDFKDNPGWDMDRLFADTIQLIQTHKFPLSTAEIEFFELSYRYTSNPQGYTPVMDHIRDLIQRIESPNVKAYARSVVAYDLASRGVNQDLPQYFAEIRSYLQTRNPDGEIIDIDTLNGVSVALEQIGQLAEARVITRKLDAFCATHVMREFCASRAYELGRDAVHANQFDEGLAFFSKALKLATEIQDEKRTALSYYGLGNVHHKLQNFATAVPYFQKAIAIFIRLEMKDWAATSFTNLSKVYQSMQQDQDALKAVNDALAICPEGFKLDRMSSYLQLASLYEQMNQPWDALRALKRYGELEKETSADDAQKKYMQLRNESLSAQNEMQATQIHLLKKFQVVSIIAVGLSLLLIAALGGIARQSKKVRASQRKMREILDHIAEGILILDRQIRIDSGYSPYLDHIFDSPPSSLTGRSFLEVLFPSDGPGNQENLYMTQAALIACIGENSWSWDLNKGHLPHEVQVKDRTLAIHWQPLYDTHQLITSFLVSVRDESQLRAMQQLAQQQTRRVERLQNKLQEILAGKHDLMRHLLKQIADEWQTLQNSSQRLQRLHTFKGAARTLGLRELAAHIHEMESRLTAHSATTEPKEQWNQLSTILADYDHLLNSLMASRPGETEAPRDLYAYASLYANEAAGRLREGSIPFQGVRVLDQVGDWEPRILHQVHEIILHGIANAVDHGFLRAKESKAALIEIEATQLAQAIQLTLADNGAGIDMDFVASKAKALGFTPEPGRPLTDILFIDGLSTASSVSQTSGRGVGLSAIQSICRALQASVAITPRTEGGTLLTIILPDSR